MSGVGRTQRPSNGGSSDDDALEEVAFRDGSAAIGGLERTAGAADGRDSSEGTCWHPRAPSSAANVAYRVAHAMAPRCSGSSEEK